MKKYNTVKIGELDIDQYSSRNEDYIAPMDAASFKINGCLNNLGTYADIISVEHYETYSAFAENMYINFTTCKCETYGDNLIGDKSSTKIEDYDYSELTKLNVFEDE